MLNLQRASAGSGKTYSLARTYLKLLLGIRREDGTYRLREPAETRDAHSRLLAITFTNKATAEMRKRFIDKLAALASAGDAAEIDYMPEFMRLFNASQTQIERIAKLSLSAILNHYSDFQVSTIDSFFQQILHSFTYEAELPDNYAVELDTNLVISYALESLFEIARSHKDSEEHYWLNVYMSKRQQNGIRWNISQRGTMSAYGTLFAYLKMIDKESFKQERESLTQFLSSHVSLRPLYLETQRMGEKYVANALTNAKDCACAIETLFAELNLDSRDITSHLRNRIEKIKSALPSQYCFSSSLSSLKKILNKSGLSRLDSESLSRIQNLEEELCRRVNIWSAASCYVEMVIDSIPMLALIGSLLRQMEIYRTDNNIIQLSDTNTILHTITAGTDVPFIYEKIGTQIDSYMIDEFQDTSTMQWQNMRPLIEQSLSEGNDDLIIGDAKQSIYRFRNADSSLITHLLPAQFAGHGLTVSGATPAENANRRSAAEIILFNNAIFSHLSKCLDTTGCNSNIAETYAGVLQQVVKPGQRGYVEIHDISHSDSENKVNMDYLGAAISDMLSRGYRMRDIAILVRTNVQGQMAVKALIDYNSQHKGEDNFTPIDFISDEALLISRAKSVEIVTAMLAALNAATDEQKLAGENADNHSSHTDDVEKFNIIMHRLRATYPQMNTDSLLDLYFAGTECNAESAIIPEISTVALPALVEYIISHYVPESLRKTETQYLFAFQDAVIAYCESHQPDVASFLSWWQDKGKNLCITSPEDADAVNILTIHKSKGLEWRCVLIPEFDFSLSVSGGEQKWLAPASPFDAILPKLIPINMSSKKNFIFTPYEQDYLEVQNQTRLDTLNVAYVAFTRAVDELYVFINPAKKGETLAKLISAAASDVDAFYADDENLSEYFPAKGSVMVNEDSETEPLLIYGEKPELNRVQQRNRILDENSQDNVITTLLADYYVNPDHPQLNYVIDGNQPDSETETGDSSLKETDAERRLGIIQHEVMEGIRPGFEPAAEIERMLLRTLVRGKATKDEVDNIRTTLQRAFSLPEAEKWFAAGVRVYTERTLYDKESGRELRPDRIVVDNDGHATVIDYKFGHPQSVHRRQVMQYVKMLRETRMFASVSGVVWYVATGKIECVDC